MTLSRRHFTQRALAALALPFAMLGRKAVQGAIATPPPAPPAIKYPIDLPGWEFEEVAFEADPFRGGVSSSWCYSRKIKRETLKLNPMGVTPPIGLTNSSAWNGLPRNTVRLVSVSVWGMAIDTNRPPQVTLCLRIAIRPDGWNPPGLLDAKGQPPYPYSDLAILDTPGVA